METNTWVLKHIKHEELCRTINKEEFRIGRSKNLDLPSKNILISRNHAVLVLTDGKLYVKDNNSLNGTYVNHLKINNNELIQIFEGDEVGLGTHTHEEVPNANLNDNYDFANLIFIVKHTKIEAKNKNTFTLDVGTSTDNKCEDCVIISDDEESRPTPQSAPNILESVNTCSNRSEMSLSNPVQDNPFLNPMTKPKSSTNTDDLLQLLDQSQFEDDDDKNMAVKNEDGLDIQPIIKEEPVEILNCNYTTKDDFIVISDDEKESIHYSQLMDGTSPDVDFNDVIDIKKEESIYSAVEKEVAEMDAVRVGTVIGTYDLDYLEPTGSPLGDYETNHTELNGYVANNHVEQEDDVSKSASNLTIYDCIKKTDVEKNGELKNNDSCNNQVMKRKPAEDCQVPLKKIKTGVFCDGNDPRRSNKFTKIDKDKGRKEKLRNIAIRDNAKNNRRLKETSKTPAAKKIKVSDSRGKFLVDDTETPSTSKSKQMKSSSVRITKSDTCKTSPKKTIQIIPPHVEKKKSTRKTNVDCKVSNATSISARTMTERRSEPSKLLTHRNKSHQNTTVKKFHSVEDIIHQILRWNTAWFVEYKLHEEWGIPVNMITTKLQIMPRRFCSYETYHDIVIPQMMVELWCFLCKETDRSSDLRKQSFHGLLTQERKLIDKNVTILSLDTVITKDQNEKSLYVKEEDLLIVQYFSDEQVPKKMCNFVFGVVNKVNKYVLQPNDSHVKQQFAKYVGAPVAIIHFDVMIKLRKENAKLQMFSALRVITSIRSAMRIFKSVKSLKDSKLKPYILQPTKELYCIKTPAKTTLYSKDNLNESQKKAVLGASYVCQRNQPGIYLIQGPPGTGKTRVILNIIQEILFDSNYSNQKCILVVAPSNGAVDEVARRIIALKHKLKAENRKLKLVRCGLKNMIHHDVQDYSLYELAKCNLHKELMNTASYSNRELMKSRLDAFNALRVLSEEKGADLSIKHKLNTVKIEYERTCRRVTGQSYYDQIRKHQDRLLNGAQIICTTLSSCVALQMEEVFGRYPNKIGCCIIDEATQSNEQETLIPLILGVSKIVLVGDPKQLPAVTQAKEAKDHGYGESLFSRIMSNFPNDEESPVQLLNVQYRMHPEISQFPNQAFYNGQLKDSPVIIKRKSIFKILHPYLVFNFDMEAIMNSQEYSNKAETLCVLKLLNVITHKFKASENYSIGIITPYNNQKDKISDQLRIGNYGTNITVNTVDSFQGQEKDIIIMSCVRESTNSFLGDEQRLNVALTRARHVLYIIGSSNLFSTCYIFGKIKSDACDRKLFIKVSYGTSESQLLEYISKKQRK